QRGVLDVAAEPQLVRALVRHRDANAGLVDLRDGAYGGAGRYEIGRRNLEVRRGEGDLVRTLGLGAEKGDVPRTGLHPVGQLAGRVVLAELDRHAEAPGQLARQVGGDAARVGGRGARGDEQEILVVEAHAEGTAGREVGADGGRDVVGHDA